jgi:hypothetical protein
MHNVVRRVNRQGIRDKLRRPLAIVPISSGTANIVALYIAKVC